MFRLVLMIGCIMAACSALSQLSSAVSDDAQVQEQVDDETPDRWMLAKRHHAQNIFRGLTDGDFKKIADSGRRLMVSGILEKWVRDNEFVKRSEYQGQLHAFEFANKELIRHAEAEDIDGAFKAYVKLSQSCVKCHKLLRDVK